MRVRMLAKIGFVSFDDLPLKPAGLMKSWRRRKVVDNFWHATDNEEFLEQALELFGNVCQQVHVCGKDGICERIAIDGTNELDKPHGAHGKLVDLADGERLVLRVGMRAPYRSRLP